MWHLGKNGATNRKQPGKKVHRGDGHADAKRTPQESVWTHPPNANVSLHDNRNKRKAARDGAGEGLLQTCTAFSQGEVPSARRRVKPD